MKIPLKIFEADDQIIKTSASNILFNLFKKLSIDECKTINFALTACSGGDLPYYFCPKGLKVI